MEEYLRPLIDQVYQDFRQGLATERTYCDLLALNFTNGTAPNYTSPLVQQLYLLRYFPAYLVEYYLAWGGLLASEFLTDLCALSIGAGNGVDYTALRYAARDLGDSRQIRYHGVDRVRWLYRDHANQPPCHYYYSEIGLWTGFRNCEYNVFAFPKSISELSPAVFWNLLHALECSHFSSQRICLLSSLRASHAREDMDRLEALVKVLQEAHGYQRLDAPYSPTVLENIPISQISGYEYPEEPYRFLHHLTERCPGFDTCTMDDCGVGRCPMLNTGGMQCQAVRLERSPD